MLTLRKSLGVLFITSLLFTGSVGSLKEVRSQIPVAPADSLSRTDTFIQDQLYFGRSRAEGIISEAEFQKFLSTQITPRFPDGLTIIDANGQFRNRAGTIIKEPTKIVILIYPNSREKRQAIQDIINLYKSQFQQESVLRVSSIPVRVEF
ncbi:MAG TPA: DUF3574 domain-containing protein [Cyanobacteria bacterium UBA11049]|nr:DUF3574 domain-containing protein [Cyanobacteria bacterium UBA11049]